MTTIPGPFVGDLAELHIAPTFGGTLSVSTKIGNISEFGDLAFQKNVVEYSAFGDAYKSKAAGKKNIDNFSMTLNFDPSDTQHAALKTAYDGADAIFLSIVWKFGSENARADLTAIVSSYVITTPEEEVVSVQIEVAVSGTVTLDTTTDALLAAW